MGANKGKPALSLRVGPRSSRHERKRPGMPVLLFLRNNWLDVPEKCQDRFGLKKKWIVVIFTTTTTAIETTKTINIVTIIKR